MYGLRQAHAAARGDLRAVPGRIRREALGEQAGTRIEAEREMKRHGVAPHPGTKKK